MPERIIKEYCLLNIRINCNLTPQITSRSTNNLSYYRPGPAHPLGTLGEAGRLRPQWMKAPNGNIHW
jgi:hypothetical protein